MINVSELSGDTVKFGAIVTIVDEDSEKGRWQIVGEPEADARAGKISVFSPIPARALIGNAKNATVEVLTPSGAKAYKISNVQWGCEQPV